MSARAKRRPYWPIVTDIALQEDNLPRVLAALFPLYCGSIPRGSFVWWQPDYLRFRQPQRVAAADAAAMATREAWDTRDRAFIGGINRNMRDAPVYLLADTDQMRITVVDGMTGEWRSVDGAQRGNDLPSLGALRWTIRYGQAAFRIARLCGLKSIPLVEVSNGR